MEWRGSRRRTAWVLFALAFAAFVASPEAQVKDSRYTLLVTHQILAHGSLALDEYAPPPWGVEAGRAVASTLPYQLFPASDGHVYYYFPLGTSVLALPYVAAAELLGFSVIDASGTYRRKSEKHLQRLLAALLMAGLTSVFHLSARSMLPRAPSVWVALAAAFGTQLWSSASRALWSHTFQILILGIVLWQLLRWEIGERRPGAACLGTLLAWAYFVRPTSLVSIACLLGYVAFRDKTLFTRSLAALFLWLGLFATHSWSLHGAPLPPYYSVARLDLQGFWSALAGLLVSPGRGLLVYVPISAFVAFLIARHARDVRPRALALTGCAAIAGHLGLVAAFPHWWGGHSYGPRLLTDAVPWLVLLGILGLDARRRHGTSAGEVAPRWGLGRPLAIAGLILLGTSAAMNAIGAISVGGDKWNRYPVNVDLAPERLWDWTDPPFLRRLDGTQASGRAGASSAQRSRTM